MSKQLRLDVAQLTDVGRKRPHNEDNMAYVIPKDEKVMTKKGALFIVADGMGGHAAGEVASEIAVDTVSNVYYQDDNEDITLSLINAIKKSNALIHQRAAENMQRSGMGTTCVAAVLCGNVAYIANVGDSRAYLVRRGYVRQVSQDHSWVEEQVRAGLLTKDQARSHAQRNVITRSLGTQAEVEVDLFTEILEPGDTLILCSDGLSGSIADEDFSSIVDRYQPQESVYHLVERANENGGPDNITAIVVRVQELGEENLDIRHPVHAGSRVADEKTTVLGRVATSSLGAPARSEDKRAVSAPLPPLSGPLDAPTNAGAASMQTATSSTSKRSRLLFPTVAIILVVLLATAAVSSYFILNPSSTQASLDQANKLLLLAKSDTTSRPENSLRYLTQAQNELRQVKSEMLNQEQRQQFSSLQNTLSSELKVSLTNYNNKSLITALPCIDGQPVALNSNGATITPIAFALVRGEKNAAFSYVLSADNILYQLDKNNALAKISPVSDKVILLAHDAQRVYLLTQAKNQEYTVHVLKPEADGKLSQAGDDATTVINTNVTKGFSLRFMTAWSNDIYMVLASQTNPNQARIVAFKADKLGDAPKQTDASVSTPIIGAAAWPDNKVFLLHEDGHVRSLQVGTSNAVGSEVVLESAIAPLWPVDVKGFSVATPIGTPTSAINRTLSVPTTPAALSLLSSGSVNGAPHVYVMDNVSHRVLDLTLFSGGNVGGASNASASVSLKLERQYTSPTVLPLVSAMVVEPTGNQLKLVTQKSNALQLVSIGVSKQNVCKPAS